MFAKKKLRIILVILFILIVLTTLIIFIINMQLLKKDIPNSENSLIINETWLNFDGVNDYFEINNSELFYNASNASFQLCFINKDMSRLSPLLTIGNEYGISFYVNNGNISILYYDSLNNIQYYTYPYNYSFGYRDKSCLFYFYNGTTHYLFIDGIYIGKKTITNSSTFDDTIYLGKLNDIYFNGSISSFTIYNRDISGLEIVNFNYTEEKFYNYSIPYEVLNYSSSLLVPYVINSTLIYAISNTNRLQKSTDGGKTWINIKNFSSATVINWIFKDSKGNFYVDMGGTGNISVSLGNDSNWNDNIMPWICDNSRRENLSSSRPYGITETSDGKILLGEYGNGNMTIKNCSYIHMSEDGGTTWNVVYNGSLRYPSLRHVHFVQTDPYTGRIYASLGDISVPPNWICSAGNCSVIIRSDDGGYTWTEIYNLPSSIGNAISQPVSIEFTPNYRIFGTDTVKSAGIYRTSDDENFDFTLNLTGDISNFVWALRRDPITGNILAGGTTTTDGGFNSNKAVLLYSPNEGLNWYGLMEKPRSVSNSGYSWISNFDELGNAYFYDNSVVHDVYKINFSNINRLQNDLGLIVKFKFNENTGTTVYDSSGNDNHGTIFGATWQNDSSRIIK